MIKFSNVSKVIKKKEVLSNITLTLTTGNCYLLTGHNGSGKTMLLRLLAGLIAPSSGIIKSPKDYFYGVIIENPNFLNNETVYRNLELLAKINNHISSAQIDFYLTYFDLINMKNSSVKKLSLGMNQRLALCQAFMENQDVILLDEPFNALDAENTTKLINLIKQEKENGKIIVVAAHNISSEMESIFDKVFTMINGTISS